MRAGVCYNPGQKPATEYGLRLCGACATRSWDRTRILVAEQGNQVRILDMDCRRRFGKHRYDGPLRSCDRGARSFSAKAGHWPGGKGWEGDERARAAVAAGTRQSEDLLGDCPRRWAGLRQICQPEGARCDARPFAYGKQPESGREERPLFCILYQRTEQLALRVLERKLRPGKGE